MAFTDYKLTRTLSHYIDGLINAVLSMDPESRRELAMMKDKTLGLEVTDTRLSLCLVVTATGFRLQSGDGTEPDVCIRGTASGLLGYLLAGRPGSSRPAGAIEVIGDVNLAQEFQSIMKRFEPDWEEAMSRWTGDAVARKFGNLVRESTHVLKKGLRTLELDVSEYLRFETGTVPDQSEINEFFSKVEELRNDVERLKVRIARLG